MALVEAKIAQATTGSGAEFTADREIAALEVQRIELQLARIGGAFGDGSATVSTARRPRHRSPSLLFCQADPGLLDLQTLLIDGRLEAAKARKNGASVADLALADLRVRQAELKLRKHARVSTGQQGSHSSSGHERAVTQPSPPTTGAAPSSLRAPSALHLEKERDAVDTALRRANPVTPSASGEETAVAQASSAPVRGTNAQAPAIDHASPSAQSPMVVEIDSDDEPLAPKPSPSPPVHVKQEKGAAAVKDEPSPRPTKRSVTAQRRSGQGNPPAVSASASHASPSQTRNAGGSLKRADGRKEPEDEQDRWACRALAFAGHALKEASVWSDAECTQVRELVTEFVRWEAVNDYKVTLSYRLSIRMTAHTRLSGRSEQRARVNDHNAGDRLEETFPR